MKVTDLHEFVNDVTKTVLGENGVLEEDFGNLVDLGTAILQGNQVDNYVGALVNKVGKTIFVDRKYEGNAPSVLMDSWEFGSILEKIEAELPEAEENESWSLKDRESYDQDVFYKPVVKTHFWNSKVAFEVPLSFTDLQVKESFTSVNQLNAFISMLTTSVENSITVKLDGLIMRTIANMAAETLNTGRATQAVNLLERYNDETSESLTVANALLDADFLRFASLAMGVASDRMVSMSKLFNGGGSDGSGSARFTPRTLQHVVLLSDFAKASDVYLAANTEHAARVALPEHDVVPYWQGSGTGYAFDDVSKINAKTASGAVVEQSGVLGVMFDRNALGVTQLDRRVTTHYNAKAEFYTNFYKFDAGYFNDISENFIVFYIADAD